MTDQKPSYFFSRFVPYGFDESKELILDFLKDEGFGLMYEIDVKNTLKEKIDVDFGKKYTILGVCNPQMAKDALEIEDKLGIMMPCNVVVIEQPEGTEVAAVNAQMFSQIIENDRLECFANEVRGKLRRAMQRL